ncbi:HAMP domain-containing protein [Pseudodesulfovibrio cashew]|uniref:histidine kinase n=1 Tax=Pseudodesulfovibrio cashew TaxID=2678688 RepID=A0A6I6JGR6_9BACT|nr:HAMP domain-containing sensor histidine kinase [Pseudodesulfovibrio cashew]QGY39562.1 HAMP domain-containing protein [Pseudodesulfovibrio cashew]
MKISQLYFKILAAFVVVQVLAVLAIVLLVRIGKIQPPPTRHAEERTDELREILREELAGRRQLGPALERRLDDVLGIYVRAFEGYAWVTDDHGRTVAKSFPGNPPLSGTEEIKFSRDTPAGGKLYLLERGPNAEEKNMYGVTLVPFHGAVLTVHVLHQWGKHREEVWFFKGLLLMGTLSALMLIPISRRISRPINQLTDSAEHLARGDFSPRVDTNRQDEVGRLARTFNHMAENLEKMIRGGRELTANLSHELRSPLARIRISQQIIRDRLDSGRTDGVAKHVAKMEAEIDHMDGLIDKILRLSKFDLQDPGPREDAIDLNDFIEEAVQRQQPLMERKAMTVRRVASSLPAYRCRAEDIRMVLDNVLANAVKYGPENGEITVESLAGEEALTVAVSNPYPPLTAQELEALFTPFKRLGYDDVEGNGLGLAFARRIVEDHGGTMSASSTNGTFRMTLLLPLD